ncbi:dolichyl-phosphate beta-glucosyltransferase [Homalodisca vitripennis]|nr:dolichyl-phosphate beta-glucosyltransferase [Homalodisca vitripennis]
MCIVLMKTTTPYPVVERAEEEKSFLNTNEGLRILFPSIEDPFSVLLSVIVPAYDEEKRLPPMLDECFEFLEARRRDSVRFTYEVIVVSDGSKDRTVEVAQRYTREYGANQCRVLDLRTNRGKGGAVRLATKYRRRENMRRSLLRRCNVANEDARIPGRRNIVAMVLRLIHIYLKP